MDMDMDKDKDKDKDMCGKRNGNPLDSGESE